MINIILFFDGKSLIAFLEDGSLKDYDAGSIYTSDEIAAVQRRVPYDLFDDPNYLKFCGR